MLIWLISAFRALFLKMSVIAQFLANSEYSFPVQQETHARFLVQASIESQNKRKSKQNCVQLCATSV